MGDITTTYQLNFTGDQINDLLTRINNLDIELNNYLLKNGGTMTGAINMNGQSITGLGVPTENSQVANKEYVDLMLPKSGGTMTGAINMGGNKMIGLGTPTANTDAATKGYADLAAYPVGAIYISTVSTSPASLFGGTWEQLKDRFLLASGDTYSAGSTGGEAAHTLTIDEMPSHSHGYSRPGRDSGTDWIGQSGVGAIVDSNTNYAGGGQSHNNMPPYYAVYMWQRVA